MDELNDKEASNYELQEGCHWVPEYGAWMVEATPARPYTGYVNDLLRVERNMRLRRRRLMTALKENEAAPTISAYFLLGTQGEDGSLPPTSVGGVRRSGTHCAVFLSKGS
jgi:glutamate--cysteine ligase catalytic subunit